MYSSTCNYYLIEAHIGTWKNNAPILCYWSKWKITLCTSNL